MMYTSCEYVYHVYVYVMYMYISWICIYVNVMCIRICHVYDTYMSYIRFIFHFFIKFLVSIKFNIISFFSIVKNTKVSVVV